MTAAKPKRTIFDDPVEAELARWPGVTWSREVRGKHYALVLSFGCVSRFVIYSGSPSDGLRGAMNHLQDVRGVLRDLGATRKAEPKAPARARKRAPAVIEAVKRGERPDAGVGPLSDPFAALVTVRGRLVDAAPFILPIRYPPRRSIFHAIASVFRRAA